MMNKEQDWMKKRLGMITASEASSFMSASGKITDGVVSYIRSKRFERVHGYSLPVSSRAMDIGNETEPMIMEWCRSNLNFGKDIVYSKDCDDIPFWVASDCPLGASPDAFIPDESLVLEFKTLVGNEATEFFMDGYTSYVEKRARVFKEHGDQILAQFASNPKVETICLIKYAPQRDDIMEDTDSPLAPWRGILFEFNRKDFVDSIDYIKQRVNLIDAMIDSTKNPMDFKKGDWKLSDSGVLYCE